MDDDLTPSPRRPRLIAPAPPSEAALERLAEDRHLRTWPEIDDRLDMDLEPYPNSRSY